MTKGHVTSKLLAAKNRLQEMQEEYTKWTAEQNEDLGLEGED